MDMTIVADKRKSAAEVREGSSVLIFVICRRIANAVTIANKAYVAGVVG